MNTFLQDLRFGLRLLVKSPGFAVVAVLTLAIGISANTAIFSVIDAVLLRPLAIKEPARVMYLDEVWRGLNPGLSVGNYADIHRRSSSFANAAASNSNNFNLAAEDFPAREQGEAVTWDYFSTFGVPPLAGRVFTADDDKPGAAPVAIISERLWRNRLHADPEIVGQTLRINSVPTTVVGIMPRSFDPLLTSSDIWVPAAFTAEQLADHDNHYLNMMARLKPGVSVPQAQSELNVIAQHLQQEFPMHDEDRRFRATPLATMLLGDQRLSLRLMLTAVGFLLLIACANIANLQLVRSRSRRKEIAMRAERPN